MSSSAWGGSQSRGRNFDFQNRRAGNEKLLYSLDEKIKEYLADRLTFEEMNYLKRTLYMILFI